MGLRIFAGKSGCELKRMTKRKHLKLGAGVISLAALATGYGNPALAQTLGQSTGSRTATQLSFELAMAQSAAATVLNADKQKTAQVQAPVATATIPGPDGLTDGAAYVEADHLKSLDKDNMAADGHVEMRYKEKTIRADHVTYNAATGDTLAEGHTQTINADGSVQFADRITYNEDKQTGVSENLALMAAAPDNTKIFARRFSQIDQNTNQMTNVIFTPCELCVKKGQTQEPSWSIQASEITQRKDKKMVFYHNAVLRVKGVPVFYSPFFWSPDPELDRASGFLSPKIGTGKKRGFSWEQPYLWSISPYQQLIISPQFNAEVNPLLNLDYQRHFYSGLLHIRAGITSETYFDNHGERIGNKDTRGYILADGHFKINDDWRWSFTAQHVKDDADAIDTATGKHYQYDNFFERYNIDDAFNQDTGDLTSDSRVLINQFNVTRQVSNAYFAVTMVSFQSMLFNHYLDTVNQTQGVTLRNDFFPTIAPQVEAYWSPKSRLLGGQLTASLTGIGIQHKISPELIPGNGGVSGKPPIADSTSGFDTARASAGLSWYGNMTTRSGVKWGPFIDLRHDYYHEKELTTAGLQADVNRDLSTAGFNISYPLYKRIKGGSLIIEPVAQLAISPKTQINPNLPTEDSTVFQLDDTTLFKANKSPGFDVYEGGSRLNLGLRSQLTFDTGFHAEGLIGRVLRDDPEPQYLRTVAINGLTINNVANQTRNYSYDPYGLGKKSSDWVFTGDFDTSKGFYGYTRLRVDGDTGKFSQGEAGLSIARPNTVGTVRYIFNDQLTQSSILSYYNDATYGAARRAQLVADGKLKVFGNNYRDLQIYARHFFTKHWGVMARIDRDLVENTWRRSQVGLIYSDDCSSYELIYQKNDTLATRYNGKATSTVLFRFNFATLGTSGSRVPDAR